MGLLIAGLIAINLSAEEPLLSAADLNALERENTLWRSVKVSASVEENFVALKKTGFTEAEIAAVTPKLIAIWENPAPRQFGWLSADAVEKIRAVDDVYLPRLRAARLRVMLGVQLANFKKETPLWVNAQWRRAVFRVLEYGEMAEFNRMNSEFARRVNDRAETLELSVDERRTLIEWEREFVVTHGNPANWNAASPRDRAWHEDAQAELHDRTRTLLGDERAADYLAASNREFDRVSTALSELNLDATKLLDLWALRREHRRQAALDGTYNNMKKLMADSRTQVSALLGEETFDHYARLEEAKWLFPRAKMKPVKAEVSARTP